MGHYPSIARNEGLKFLKKQFNNFDEKSIPTEDLVKIAEFVLKNYFNSNVKHQISRTGTGIKFAPTLCMYIYGLHGESISQI